MASILQVESRRDRGDRVMPRVTEVLDILEAFGYTLSGQRYEEQAYYKKTVIKDTADHGQFKLDLVFEDHGASVIGSNDCQLPLTVFLGVCVQGEVLPMVKALEVKNLSCYDSRISLLNLFIPNANAALANICQTLDTVQLTDAQSLAAFVEVQGYKSSIMTCLPCVPVVQAGSGYEVFLNLVNTLIYGDGISPTGKKVRRIKHIRRKVQLIDKMLKVLLGSNE